MKKILLATSILAATTGFAAAEVTLSGDARMGLVYNGSDVNFSSRARVKFTLAGETDTGLSFGASFRADQALAGVNSAGDELTGIGAIGNTRMGSGTVFISGGFGKLEMGDVASAGEAALGDLSGVGYTGLGDFSDIPYINGDGAQLGQGTGALYSYSASGFGFYMGLFDGDDGSHTSEGSGTEDTGYSVGVSYGTDAFTVALAYLNNGEDDDATVAGANVGEDEIILGGSTTFGAATLKAYYADFGDYADMSKSYGLSVDYALDAVTLTAFARRDEDGTNAEGEIDDVDSFGLGAAYDMGGGAVFKAGVVDSDALDDTVADLGITMSF